MNSDIVPNFVTLQKRNIISSKSLREERIVFEQVPGKVLKAERDDQEFCPTEAEFEPRSHPIRVEAEETYPLFQRPDAAA